MEVTVIRAKESDQDRVFDFLAVNFYPDEPLNQSLYEKQETTRENCASLGILKDNLSFIAVEKDDPNAICAVCINKEMDQNVLNDDLERLVERTAGTNYGKILKFLNDAGAMSDNIMNEIWAKYDTNRAMDIFMLSVRKDCRRQNLAHRLMEMSIKLAQEKKYRWISIGCTSNYSTTLAKKLGFKVVFKLPYNEYKNEQGEVVFRMSPPHDAFSILIKELPA